MLSIILKVLLFINKKRINNNFDWLKETIDEMAFICHKRPLEDHVRWLMMLKDTGISYKIALKVFRRLYPMNLK